MKRRGSWPFFWLALSLVLGIRAPSLALVVTPARTEVHMAPGASSPVVITVTNDDKAEIQVDVSKKDWFIPDFNKAFTVDRWMNIHGPSRFTLKPGQSRKVEITLQCPKEMVGEVVGMASFIYKTEQLMMVTPMISVSHYLIAAGTEKMSGEVTGMMVRVWNNEVHISAHVVSTGNVHLRPSGRLLVLNSKGTVVGETGVPEGQPTYPGRDNFYYGALPDTVKLSPGSYTARAELAYQDLKLQGDQRFKVLKNGQIQMEPMEPKTKAATVK
jgi:hypothetical protein